MLFSSPRCPVDAVNKLWIEQRMCWLVESFGLDQILEARVLTPDALNLPDKGHLNDDEVESLFQFLCEWLHLDRSRFELEIFGNQVPPDEYGSIANGYYEKKCGHRLERILIRDGLRSDPQELVFTIAHELCHALLLGDRKLSIANWDHEWVTDLAVVFFGLGIFSANRSTIQQGQELGRVGYLGEARVGYALALFAWTRNEAKPNWLRYLRPNALADVKRSLKYLAKTGDSLLGPGGYAKVGLMYEGCPDEELVSRLEQESPSESIAIIRELRQRKFSSSKLNRLLAGFVCESEPLLAEEAGDALGLQNECDLDCVAQLSTCIGHRDRFRWQIAANVLGEIGQAVPDRVLPSLSKGVYSQHSDLRQASILSIGKFKQHAGKQIETLTRIVGSMVYDQIIDPIIALGEIGPPAVFSVPNLLRAVHEGEGPIREQAVIALGKIGDRSPKLIEDLIGLVDDEDCLVRDAALETLTQLDPNHPSVIQALRKAASHADLDTRIGSAACLLRIEGQEARALELLANLVRPILDIENRKPNKPCDETIYYQVRQALTGSKHFRCIPLLIEMSNGDDSYARRFSFWALTRIGADQGGELEGNSIEFVVPRHLIQNDGTLTDQLLNCFAAWNLNQNIDVATSCLIKVLSVVDLSGTFDAWYHHGSVGRISKQFITEWIHFLENESELFRAVVHVAFREIGADAVSPIQTALSHETNPTVCRELARILAAIAKDQKSPPPQIRELNSNWDARKWNNTIREWHDQLVSQQRRYELTVMDVLMPNDNTDSELSKSAILEAEHLLVLGRHDLVSRTSVNHPVL